MLSPGDCEGTDAALIDSAVLGGVNLIDTAECPRYLDSSGGGGRGPPKRDAEEIPEIPDIEPPPAVPVLPPPIPKPPPIDEE